MTNVIGKRFGRLTIVKELEPIIKQYKSKTSRIRMMQCKCDCGNVMVVRYNNLTSNNTLSCGCVRKEMLAQMREVDLTGKRFGRLFVEKKLNHRIGKRKHIAYKCICDCGNVIERSASRLGSGKVNSCGCLRKEITSDIRTKNILGSKIGLLTPFEKVDSVKDSTGRSMAVWKCRCDCGNIINVKAQALTHVGTKRSCGCLGNSYGERQIIDYLKENNINFKPQVTFDDLRSSKNYKLKFDFGIYDSDSNLLFLLEYQGRQHFEVPEYAPQVGQRQREETDQLKIEYCSNNNIPLEFIIYNEDCLLKLKTVLSKYSYHVDPVPSNNEFAS